MGTQEALPEGECVETKEGDGVDFIIGFGEDGGLGLGEEMCSRTKLLNKPWHASRGTLRICYYKYM